MHTLNPVRALGAQSPVPLACLMPLESPAGPLNRGAPWMKAPTAEWIFVLNERDPRGTERQVKLLGPNLLLLPAAAASSWHHRSPPWRILGKKGAAICIFLFPMREGRPDPLTCTPAWQGWARAAATPLTSFFRRPGRVAGVPVWQHPMAELSVLLLPQGLPRRLGWEGTPVTRETQRPGKKEGVWLGCLFAVTPAREQPRCQSPGGCGESFRPSDVATPLS